jgi:probable addiction module antidote protein
MTIVKKRKYRKFDDFVVAEFKKDPELANHFLETSIKEYEQDSDDKTFLIAIRQVALAKGGFSELSKKTGLSRESLYKTLSEKGNPHFITLKKILEALDYKLSFQRA